MVKIINSSSKICLLFSTICDKLFTLPWLMCMHLCYTHLESQTPSFLLTIQLLSGYDEDD